MGKPYSGLIMLLLVSLLTIIITAIKVICFQLHSKKCIYPITAQIIKHKNFLYCDDPYYKAIYSYCYENKIYKGTTEFGYTDEDKVKKRYPVGKSITVYIDPQKPQKSCEYLRKRKKC